ncbi:SufD family Fe-S cluster assembly protein, partial [bacterium]|nr:SufD family Fe-S cluster assembly protein [bacterium]
MAKEILTPKRTTPQILWTPQDNMASLEAANRTRIPKKKTEDWRYTNPDTFPWEKAEAAVVRDAHIATPLNSELETNITLPALNAEILRGLLAVADDGLNAKFLHLHHAMQGSVAAYRITADNRAPVQIVQRVSDSAALTTVLFVESGADAVVCSRWESEAADISAVIGRIEIILEDGARLHFLQEDELAFDTHFYRRAHAQLGENAVLNWGHLTTGSVWNASKLELELDKSGAECSLYGLFCGGGTRQAETRTLQHHKQPRTQSNLLYKSLLSEKSRSIFQGMIRVERAAQHTEAYQACRNLMLSGDARADAIPRLEILPDDVHCSHGATMGTADDDMLFYLMTRGLNRSQAL